MIARLALNARDGRFAFDTGRFSLSTLDARIGAGENPVLMQAGTLDGTLGKGGALSGTLAQGHAIIGPGAPRSLRDCRAMAVRGRRPDARRGAARCRSPGRRPVQAAGRKGRALRLVDGRIAAKGTLVQPDRNVNVATLVIAHDLGTGIGRADFALDNLRFGTAIQPDDLTQMALGVIANVDGAAEGSGTIAGRPKA